MRKPVKLFSIERNDPYMPHMSFDTAEGALEWLRLQKLGGNYYPHDPNVEIEPGTPIRFTRNIVEGPSCDSPGGVYAYKGSGGLVNSSVRCWEGCMVTCNHWPRDVFGARLYRDFVLA